MNQLILLVLLLLISPLASSAQCCRNCYLDTCTADTQDVSPSTLIVYYNGRKVLKPLLRKLRRMHCTIIYQYNNFNALALRIPDCADIVDIMRRLEVTKGVLSVQRDRILHLD